MEAALRCSSRACARFPPRPPPPPPPPLEEEEEEDAARLLSVCAVASTWMYTFSPACVSVCVPVCPVGDETSVERTV
jgi:hypothetical protein